MATAEREMRILMSSSLDVTSVSLNELGRYFFDPYSTGAKTEGNFTVTSWTFLGGKEVLRVVHSDQLLHCPWYHRLSLYYNWLASQGKNVGLDDVFALFYLSESPMFAVDLKFCEFSRVQFGQIKVRATTKPGKLQMNIGGNSCNKEIWNQFDPKLAVYSSMKKFMKDDENDGGI